MRWHGARYTLFRSLALMKSLARRMRPRQLLPPVVGAADKQRRALQRAACLLCPFHGKRLQKPRQRHPFRLRPVQDRHDHFRRRTKQTTRRLSGYIQGGHVNRKAIAGALRSVYRAENAEAGLAVLGAFEAGPWGQK